MKTYIATLFILAFFSTGCSKSPKDVSGVYQTDEIKEQIKGTRVAYYSTIWILDISEGGSFILKENKSRRHMESKKYAPVPVKGKSHSGEWDLENSHIVLTIKPFVPLEVGEERERPYIVKIPLAIQSNGDLVAEPNDASGDNSTIGEFSPDLYLLNKDYGFEGLRFHKK